MNVSEYMRRHGLTDAGLDAMAAPYESGDYPSGGGEAYREALDYPRLLSRRTGVGACPELNRET